MLLQLAARGVDQVWYLQLAAVSTPWRVLSKTVRSRKVSVTWKVRMTPSAAHTFRPASVSMRLPSNQITPLLGRRKPAMRKTGWSCPLLCSACRTTACSLSVGHLKRKHLPPFSAGEVSRHPVEAEQAHDLFTGRRRKPRRPRGKSNTTTTKMRPMKRIQLTVKLPRSSSTMTKIGALACSPEACTCPRRP